MSVTKSISYFAATLFLISLVSIGFTGKVNSQNEGKINNYISECFTGAQNLTNNLKNPYLTKDMLNEMRHVLSNCDQNILYYANQCSKDSSKTYCNQMMTNYLQLRGLKADVSTP